MRWIHIVLVSSIIAASRASAADLPVPAGPAPAYYPVATVYDWGGDMSVSMGGTPSAKANGEAIHSIHQALVRPEISTSTAVWSAPQWALVASGAHGS
jgi:hypothetical protein